MSINNRYVKPSDTRRYVLHTAGGLSDADENRQRETNVFIFSLGNETPCSFIYYRRLTVRARIIEKRIIAVYPTPLPRVR